jgi:(heptosyl)LPS beta-1,4-glucosyltransferase
MAKISVALCCTNVGETLEAACQSVAWADELVIVDSGSTDATPEIAQRYATRYVVEPWRGYTEQKKYAASLCRNDWVLVLDGDEECAAELAAEMQSLSDAALARLDVLYMRRRTYIFHRVVRSWLPDWQSRLIHRGRTVWDNQALHDNRLPSHRARTRRLRGFLEHRRTSRTGFREFFDGRLADSRLVLIASEMHLKGRRCRWWDLAMRPTLVFLKLYLLKGGIFEGSFGLMVAQKAAMAVQLKYAALWACEHGFLKPEIPPATR